MKVGLVVYGSLDTVSGGYLYDRMIVSKLRQQGDTVEVLSTPRRSYALNLLDNLAASQASGFDLILQDELNHPSLFLSNRRSRPAPILSIVHHLRSSEKRHSLLNAVYGLVERAYLDSVDGFIFNSQTTARSVQSLARQAKPQLVATPGGDRLGHSTPEHVRRRAREPGPLRLITVANVIPGKGLDVLLDALSLLPPDAVHLQVVGSQSVAPHFAEAMRRRAAARRLPVVFRGALSDAALAEQLRTAQAFVLPSYYEGFGIAFLEAMAHGLPALGARAGGVPHIVQDAGDGYLVPPGDAAALADRIHLLIQDRDLLERMSLAALARFAAFPTWDATTEAIRGFLVAIVEEWNLKKG